MVALIAMMTIATIGSADEPTQKGPYAEMTSGHATTQPKHTNHLVSATSPYLLQHAHNPVDWYEWGPVALERAKQENKPIFLSIGYSACHWCHVMERESFENEEIAAIMNEDFICIKVDREERPDLDDIYMSATQAMTRSGGWPMSVWLTPDLKPFYAGTYFPPESRYGRPGFPDVLTFLADTWKNENEKIVEQAKALTEAVEQITRSEAGNQALPSEAIDQAANLVARQFDATRGGILSGQTNKFPPSMAMALMLRAYDRSVAAGEPNKLLLERVETTLENMAYGGIYDQLGGGIARYSTDADWLAPHFEKMLYDQALVSDIYVDAWRLTKKPLYEQTARSIFDYVLTDLRDADGGFYSARDADSEGEEGKFYVWSKKEIESVLGADAAKLFCEFYDVTVQGNWEGHNILNVPNEPVRVAEKHNLSMDEFDRRMNESREKLLAHRAKRVPPHRDDKVLSGWNGLMIASLAKAGRTFNEPRYTKTASDAAEFVLTKMTDAHGRLMRTYRDGRTHTLAYIDDHAFMIEALLNLYETTFDLKWLDAAERLNADVMKHFHDPSDGAFFFTADDAETVLVRMKNATDNAVPSGSSVQAMNMLRLSVLLDDQKMWQAAERLLNFYGEKSMKMPFSSERMLSAADFFHRRPREVAIVCKQASRRQADAMIDSAWQVYAPNLAIAMLEVDGPDAAKIQSRIALLRDKPTIDGKATAYVCENYVCQAPTTDVDKMLGEIAADRTPAKQP